MEKNKIEQMAIAIKLISKHGNFASNVKEIQLDKWFFRLTMDFDRLLLGNFQQSKKWICEITESGFIIIKRTFMGVDICILLL